jgi:hypothetical protein
LWSFADFFHHLGSFIVARSWPWCRSLSTASRRCRRVNAQLPVTSASMPAQDLTRWAQWSATTLMANTAVGQPSTIGLLQSGSATHGAGHTRCPRSIRTNTSVSKFGAPMGRADRSFRLCLAEACTASPPVHVDRFKQPFIGTELLLLRLGPLTRRRALSHRALHLPTSPYRTDSISPGCTHQPGLKVTHTSLSHLQFC